VPIDVLYLNDKYYVAFKFLFIAIDVKPTHTYYLPKFNKAGKQRFCFLVRWEVAVSFRVPSPRPLPTGCSAPARAAATASGTAGRSGASIVPPSGTTSRRRRVGAKGPCWRIWHVLPRAQLVRLVPGMDCNGTGRNQSTEGSSFVTPRVVSQVQGSAELLSQVSGAELAVR